MMCPFCKLEIHHYPQHFQCSCGAHLYPSAQQVFIIILDYPYHNINIVARILENDIMFRDDKGNSCVWPMPPLTADYDSFKEAILNKINKLKVFL